MVSSILRFPRERIEFRERNSKVVGTRYIRTCSLPKVPPLVWPRVASREKRGLDWVKCRLRRDEDLAGGGLAYPSRPSAEGGEKERQAMARRSRGER